MRTLLKPLSFIPAVLLMVMIFNFSSQPGEVSSQLSYSVSHKIVEAGNYILDAELEPWQIDEWANKINFITRKLAHMTEYFALAVAVSFPLYVYGMHGILLMLVAGTLCVGFAAGDEYHQAFVAARGPSWKDVGIDSIGIFFGIVLVRMVGWTGRKTIFKPKRQKPKVKKVKKVKKIKRKNRKFVDYSAKPSQYHYTEEHTYYEDAPKRGFQSCSGKKSRKTSQNDPQRRQNTGPYPNGTPYPGQWQPGNKQFYYGPGQNDNRRTPYGPGSNSNGQAPYGQNQYPGGQTPFGRNQNPAGQAPFGQNQNPNGQVPFGQNQNPNGQAPFGRNQNPAGQAPFGRNQNPNGQAPFGQNQNPAGQAPFGQNQNPNGQAPFGQNQNPNGQAPFGQNQNPAGQAPFGQNQNLNGQAPFGQNQNPAGQAPFGQNQNPPGQRTGDSYPYGTRSFSGTQASYRQTQTPGTQAPYGSDPHHNGSVPNVNDPYYSNQQNHVRQNSQGGHGQYGQEGAYFNGQAPHRQPPYYHTTDDFKDRTQYYDRHEQYEEDPEDTGSKSDSKDDDVDGPIEIIQKLGSKLFHK